MKKFIISFILLFSVLAFNSVYASTFSFSTLPELESVVPGEELLITLKVSDIDAGEDGINVVETKLEYDKSIIDSIEFVEKNNWKSTYNPNEGDLYGKLLYTKMVTGVKDDEEIGVLKVKIKDSLTSNFFTEIKLLQVTSNDGYTLMNDGDKIIRLVYIKHSPAPVEPEYPEEPVEPENTNTTAELEKTVTPSEPKKEDINTSEEESKKSVIPVFDNAQTGDIIGLVLVVLALFIIIYVVVKIVGNKYKNSNDNK